MFQMNVRNQKGRAVGTRPVTATAGHSHRRVPFDIVVGQKGTVEVVDLSEQDGSLACIAQLRATLAPAP
jgi:hypothetical protein